MKEYYRITSQSFKDQRLLEAAAHIYKENVGIPQLLFDDVNEAVAWAKKVILKALPEPKTVGPLRGEEIPKDIRDMFEREGILLEVSWTTSPIDVAFEVDLNFRGNWFVLAKSTSTEPTTSYKAKVLSGLDPQGNPVIYEKQVSVWGATGLNLHIEPVAVIHNPADPPPSQGPA